MQVWPSGECIFLPIGVNVSVLVPMCQDKLGNCPWCIMHLPSDGEDTLHDPECRISSYKKWIDGHERHKQKARYLHTAPTKGTFLPSYTSKSVKSE